MIEISVVIPTYNRPDSLKRLLGSLSKQDFQLKEVLIIDSSDKKIEDHLVKGLFPALNIRIIDSFPSVCKQRNIGINAATSPYVFLCDDDIELPDDYVSKLASYLSGNPQVGIASGFVLQKNDVDQWEYQFPISSLSKLVWVFIFQLSIWGDISSIRTNAFFQYFLKKIKEFYQKRGNTFSLGGWPLITDFNGGIVKCTFYGIGASIGKREWFLSSPYDENLLPNGIGDNYGVLLNFPESMNVHIITDTHVYHHKSPENRQKAEHDYFHRVLALQYFMKKSNKIHLMNRIFLIWSLVGNLLFQIFKMQFAFAKATLKAIFIIIFNINPYFRSRNK